MGRLMRKALRRQDAVGRKRPHDGQRRAQGRTGHAQSRAGKGKFQPAHVHCACGEYEQGVEHHVKQTHHDVQRARYVHVAAAAQHAAGQHVELEGGKGKDEDKEVYRSVVRNVGAAAQPAGKRAAHHTADRRKRQTERQRGQQGLTEHRTCAGYVLAAQQMGHLDRKARGGGRAHAHEQPGGGGHQPDGGRGFRTQAAHHGGIDVLHHDGRQLCHDGGYAELHRKVELLAQGHGLSVTDKQQQFVCFLLA